MVYCYKGLRNIEAANEACSICDEDLLPGDRVVLDHCHVISVIRGRAHSHCNSSFRLQNFIPGVKENISPLEGRRILSAQAMYGYEDEIIVVAKLF